MGLPLTHPGLAAAVANGLLPADAIRPRTRGRLGAAVKPAAIAPAPAAVTRFEAVLPLPPTVNTAYANVPGKGRVKTAAYRRWLDAAGLALLAAGRPVVRTPVWVEVCVLPGDPLTRPGCRWDVGNRTKLVVDLIVAHAMIPDDDREYVVGESSTWDCRYTGPAGVRVTVETVGVTPEEDGHGD